MKSYGFCLFVLLSTSSVVPAQSPPDKQSDENLDKQVKALEQQIKALQDQIDQLRQQQAPLLAEQTNRATKRWEIEARTHFAKAEIQGTLRKSKGMNVFPFCSTGSSGAAVSGWQVVVKDRVWEVRIPEKDKKMPAAAEELLNKKVLVTGTACYSIQQEPPFSVYPSYNPYGSVPGYRPPPSYLFVVSAESLQPAALIPKNVGDRKLQKSMDAVRDRIALLSRKGDDMTIRESGELVGLRETLAKLSKEWETRRNYARVQFRGKLVATGSDAWQVQIGSSGSWNLHFGSKNERKALAREQKGKRMLITGTITADPGVEPTVNVESLKRAGE